MVKTITVSSKRFHCNHNTGWFKTVIIKKLWFEVSAKYFLCLDCEDLIPLNEYEKIQHLDNPEKNHDAC